jgi:hypothetical protein
MIEKLQKFYYSAFLPEYLDSRVERELPLRDIKSEDLLWKLLFFKFSLLILFEIKLYKSFLVFFSDPFLLW